MTALRAHAAHLWDTAATAPPSRYTADNERTERLIEREEQRRWWQGWADDGEVDRAQARWERGPQ